MKTIVLVISLFSFSLVHAQDEKSDVPADPTASIEGIVNEVLDMITGDTTVVRDWEAFRLLFLPTAQFTIRYHNDRIPKQVEVINLEEFIRLGGAQYQANGFEERQLDIRYDEYNDIAQVFQTYYAKDHRRNHEERGVNVYQLVYSKDRWWIANIMWTSDANGVEIPDLD